MAIYRLIAIVVGAGLAFTPVAAFAHAHLDHATPAVGSTVMQSPKEVSLWFTEALEAKFSTIEVRDAQGKAMQAGPATLARDNTAQLRVPLKPLPPGTYKVIWRVLSVDTHRTQGDFTFRVGP
jgi:methionine-rich copper-binding protein CopC